MEMGKWYTIKAKAVKVRYGEKDKDRPLPYAVNWTREPFSTPRQAMYIGSRDVYCGDYETVEVWNDDDGRYYEDPPYFVRKYQHRVYLFVLSDRQNPIHVFPNDVIDCQPDTDIKHSTNEKHRKYLEKVVLLNALFGY